MSDENRQPPSPFDPPDDRSFRSADAPSGGGVGPGVGKPLLIGCGVVLLLLLVAGVLFVAYQDSIAAWLFTTMESQTTPRLPEDLSDAERQRYDRAFDAAVAAAEAGEVDPVALQQVQEVFSGLSGLGADESMSRETFEDLVEALEAIPGGAGTDTAPKEQERGEDSAPAGDSAPVEDGAPAEAEDSATRSFPAPATGLRAA